jgi:hypothetical protein
MNQILTGNAKSVILPSTLRVKESEEKQSGVGASACYSQLAYSFGFHL